jgi:hypothetical protein
MGSEILRKLFGSEDTSLPVSVTPESAEASAPAASSFITQVTEVIQGERQQWADTCNSGQSVILMREPTHATDPNAISVWIETPGGLQQIGYIHEAVNYDLASHMAQGAVVQACVSQIAGLTPDTPTVIAIEVKVFPSGEAA